jgi:iron(III) transport system permease protein
VLTLPVLAVMLSWLELDAQAMPILRQMLQTVLPEYALTSLLLCLAVALGVAILGMGTACAVTLFDFPGRRFFSWALLLPLAMPAYVVAYAYTDFLQYAGPLQSWARASFGLQGRLLPEIRSLGGAVLVFTVAPASRWR